MAESGFTMQNKNFNIKKYNSQRSILGQVLPLEMPLTIQLAITEACNFKCFYCVKSESIEEQKKLNVTNNTMSYDDYIKLVNNIKIAGRAKLLVLLGWGEPLIHKDICKMVKYARIKDIAEQIRIITNGAALTKEISDGLIDAGLNELKISLQGVSAEDYKKTAGVDIDYDKFVDNIEYFYKNKTNTKVIVKIMEHMINDKDKKEKFYQTFEPISDQIMIESLTPYTKTVEQTPEYERFSKTIMNVEIPDTNICTMPFMRAVINTYGELVPCCYLPTPLPLGNILNDGFAPVWNSEKRNKFLLKNLKNDRGDIPICSNCKQFVYGITSPNDVLDDFRDNLIAKYTRLLDEGDE